MKCPRVMQQRASVPMRLATISDGRICVYEIADHSAASLGHSKNQLSFQGRPRSTARALMRPSASDGGVCVPSSHFEMVVCDTAAISAIWAWVAPKTYRRMYRSGVMSEPYAETNTASSRNSETHSATVYHLGMTSEVPETLRAMQDLLGIDQKDLAGIAEVSQGTISKWLNEKQNPGKSEWDKVIAYAAKDARTAHLAHRYVIDLLGGDGLRGFFDAALAVLKPREPTAPSEPAHAPEKKPRRSSRT
jgi:transcriptional regulator with XRE-family HTH domain